MPVKPSESEDEYFARLEFERRKAALVETQGRAAEEERLRVLAVAKGRCPKCGAALVAVPYRGIEIDKCSRCQGIWLDTGELEQITLGDTGFFGSVKRIFG
jgi:hypothetical protein